MQFDEGGGMSLRENTDARSVLSPASAPERRGTIHLRNNGSDRQLTMGTTPLTRELAARESDGIHVLLLWHPDENALTVSVEDTRAGDQFQIAVEPDHALDAFYHPFAYVA
jgi:hypothetical protein